MMLAAAPFNGHHVFDNFVRLLIIFVGFTLCLVSVKIGWSTWRRDGVTDRLIGTLSYGCIVVTPSVSGLLHFGAPITWASTAFYLAGLVLAVIALAYRVTVTPPWLRWAMRRREHTGAWRGRADE